MAADKGFAGPDGLATGVKATQIIDWPKVDCGYGHGHATAIVAVLKDKTDQRSAGGTAA